MFSDDSNGAPVVAAQNCTFVGNWATQQSGGVQADDGTFNADNCIFYGNYEVPTGGGRQINMDTDVDFRFRNCLLPDYWVQSSPVTGAPYFVQSADPDGPDNIWGTADDGLMILASSPCVNAGNNANVAGTETQDLAGHARIRDGVVDVGAYETYYRDSDLDGFSDRAENQAGSNPQNGNSHPDTRLYLTPDGEVAFFPALGTTWQVFFSPNLQAPWTPVAAPFTWEEQVFQQPLVRPGNPTGFYRAERLAP